MPPDIQLDLGADPSLGKVQQIARNLQWGGGGGGGGGGCCTRIERIQYLFTGEENVSVNLFDKAFWDGGETTTASTVIESCGETCALK